jgi:hypothetical protein
MNGLYEDEPAEGEPMVAFPNARHALKMGGDESGQIREENHHEQGHPRTHNTEIDDGGRHHVAFASFGFDFIRFLP